MKKTQVKARGKTHKTKRDEQAKNRGGERKKKGGAAPRRISSAIAFVPADKERPRISQKKNS